MITEKQFEDFIQKLKKAIDEIADKTDIWDSERWNKFRRLLRNEINNLSKEVYHSPQIKPDEMQSSESEQDTCRNADDGLSAGQNKTEDKPEETAESNLRKPSGTSNSKDKYGFPKGWVFDMKPEETSNSKEGCGKKFTKRDFSSMMMC